MAKSIIIIYNGDINLSSDRNHLTFTGIDQLERKFSNLDDAINFWLECSFYRGAITKLDDILPKGYYSELIELIKDDKYTSEEVLLDSQEALYNLQEEA